jgi:hypothetical protein
MNSDEPLRFVFVDNDDNPTITSTNINSIKRGSFDATSSVSSSASIYSADDLRDVVELRALRRSTSAYDSVSASIYDTVDPCFNVAVATTPRVAGDAAAAAAVERLDANGYVDQFDDTIPMFEKSKKKSKKSKTNRKKRKTFFFFF